MENAEFVQKIIRNSEVVKELIYDFLESPKGINAECAIAASAGLVGLFTLRQHAHVNLEDLPVGNSIFIDSVSKALELRISEILANCRLLKINPDPDSGWLGELSASELPKISTISLCGSLEKSVTEVLAREFELSYELFAQILAFSAVKILSEVGPALGEGTAKKLLLRSLMEGGKTVPERMEAVH